jgi:hypothetical protein
MKRVAETKHRRTGDHPLQRESGITARLIGFAFALFVAILVLNGVITRIGLLLFPT